ncbi:formylglycine-generating enzyme family protein [bacterium]|nr:formylglycine-generating enzyme family protein [bacterium]
MKKTTFFSVGIALLCLLQACRHNKVAVAEPDPVIVAETARLEEIEREIPALKDYTDTIFGVPLEMVYVEGGTFTMGGIPGRDGNKIYGDEKPAHVVSLSSYYISRYPITQELWEAVMGDNPSEFQDAKVPISNVTQEEAIEFCIKINLISYQYYWLPTEAQWEYAARGGNRSRGTLYSGSDILPLVGCYCQSAPCVIGQYKPNELGIYDMSGGIWEWCEDWFGEFPADTVFNPQGPEYGFHKVLKGGSWNSDARSCRISHRSGASLRTKARIVGFRVVMRLPDRINPRLKTKN